MKIDICILINYSFWKDNINMSKPIKAIYEEGVFKPEKKLRIVEYSKFYLTISPLPEEDNKIKNIVSKQKKALEKLIGIGNSGKQDVSKNHDKYLYTKDS